MKKGILIYILLLMTMAAWSQTDQERQHIRQQRFQWIHAHHIGIGMETGMYENYRIAPRLYYSFGSYRNIFSVDGGLKYVYLHPMLHRADETVAAHYMAPFVATNIHFWRWSEGGLYAGAECAYHFAISGDYYLPASKVVERDRFIGNNHCSLRAKFGVKMEDWELNAHFEYDLMPEWNQKYLFESAGYKYDSLRPSLYERWRVGITLAYLITFKR